MKLKSLTNNSEVTTFHTPGDTSRSFFLYPVDFRDVKLVNSFVVDQEVGDTMFTCVNINQFGQIWSFFPTPVVTI